MAEVLAQTVKTLTRLLTGTSLITGNTFRFFGNNHSLTSRQNLQLICKENEIQEILIYLKLQESVSQPKVREFNTPIDFTESGEIDICYKLS